VIPLESAFAIADEKIGGRRVPVETVPVYEAEGRYLTSDQRSKVDLPPFDKSAVDGYAVTAGDEDRELRLEGVVSAGEPGIAALAPGTTVKVMTGAPVPRGADKVIMVEQAVEIDGGVRFENPSPAHNICKKAEDVAAGDVVVRAGSRIGALEIANLIGCGISHVEVARRIRIAILSTGDELVNSVENLRPGKIMNTNGPLLGGLARRYGLEVTGEETVPDDLSRLIGALRRSLDRADIVVLSGGVSAGDFDFVPQAIEECGLQIHFSRVATKPGKPLTFATDDTSILFGLPGNPVAVYLTFHTFILRAAALLSGGVHEPKRFKVRLARNFSRSSSVRMEFVPCRITADGMADPVPYHGSAHLAALMQADGFFTVPVGVTSLDARAEVSLVMFTQGCS
jgi:molybdopterin molybdotransferase